MSKTPAIYLSDEAITKELRDLSRRWDRLRAGDDELGGGSPGEWMVERMDELETEAKRRKAGGWRQTIIPEQSR